MPQLVLIGTASIQEYVFRSNRLRENLGASGLVRHATAWWEDPAGQAQLVNSDGRLIYQGGGNAMLVFPDSGRARAAVGAWSRHLLMDAPGLRAVVASLPYQPGGLPECFDQAHKRLQEEENRPPNGRELGATPWTRPCPSTGWAAVVEPTNAPAQDDNGVEDPALDDDAAASVWRSAEANAKRKYYQGLGRNHANRRYRSALGDGFRFPRELSLLGTVAGSSQVALIHADGNGVGEWIRRQLDRSSDANFEASLQQASSQLTTLTGGVFLTLIEELRDRLAALESDEKAGLRLKPVPHTANRYFPIRPIIDDGDDLTFIAHGRLGLALAVRYLQLFERAASAAGLTASAGVLIMPQKFPFAQGYDLVEELCRKAKVQARAKGGSWLDCHIQAEGRTFNLDSARSRYPLWKEPNQSFPVRPFCVGSESPSWSGFESSWRHFQSAWPRSEAKHLFESFSAGRQPAKSVVDALTGRRNPLTIPCALTDAFDPLELLDHYYPLEAPQ